MNKNLQLLTRILILTGFLFLLLFILFTAFNSLIFRLAEEPQITFLYPPDELVSVPENEVLYKEIRRISIPADKLYGIAVLRSGGIAVTADSHLLVFSEKISTPLIIFLQTPAECLAEGPEGNIYLGMQDHIEVYSVQGNQIDEWTTIEESSFLTSIAVNNHYVFAADANKKQIIVFDHQGKLIRFIDRYNNSQPGFLLPGPHFDCAADPDGSLWVTDPGRHKVLHLTTEGKLLSEFGSFGTDPEQFAGCCNPCHIALTPEHTIAAFEKGLHRLKLYTPDGFFIGYIVDPLGFHRSITSWDITVSASGEILMLDNHLKMIRCFIKKEQGA